MSDSVKIIFDQKGKIVSVETNQMDDEMLKLGEAMNNVVAKETMSNVEIAITKFIQNMGIPSNLLGYRYIRTAVLLAYEDEEYLRYIVKKLYVEVAKIHNTTSSKVERAIRTAVEAAWKNGNTRYLNKMFRYTINPEKGVPTNSQFLSMLVDKIKQRQIV